MDDCLQFEPDAVMVRMARRIIVERLEALGLPACVDDAVLIGSELITNALLHASGPIRLMLCTIDPSTLRIDVHDRNPRVPTSLMSGPQATRGRGLSLVTALSRAWGIEPASDGKTIWAELATNPPFPVPPGYQAGTAVPACADTHRAY